MDEPKRKYHVNYSPTWEKWEIWPTTHRYNKELDKVYHTPKKDTGMTQYYENYSVEVESGSVANATISGMQQILLRQLEDKE